MACRAILVLIAVVCLQGCNPRTIVKKDPGPHDRGVRYYRPKPYLFLKPLVAATGLPVPGHVSIEQVMLPDFSEEYSIHVRTGLGTNNTSIGLTEGWNLTTLNVVLDSQFDENLNAISNLVKSIPTTSLTADKVRVEVQATNVPMGLYEAVIAKGPDRKKRLYGFRYVGFMPFAGCPVEACGVDQFNCHEDVLYGLVFSDKGMMFCALHELPECVVGASANLTKEPALEGDSTGGEFPSPSNEFVPQATDEGALPAP